MMIHNPKLRYMTYTLSLSVLLLSNELTLKFLFATTAASFVPSYGPENSPYTSAIVHIIFYYQWEYSENLKVSFMSRNIS